MNYANIIEKLGYNLLRLMQSDISRNGLTLAILHSAGNFAILLSIPYITRVLGPNEWGITAWVQIILGYFVIIIDWGFTWSGTARVGAVKNDQREYSRILFSSWVVQILLAMMSIAAFLLICLFVPGFQAFAMFGSLWLLSVALFPAWFAGGMERIQQIALIQFCTKFSALPLVFLLVKQEGDGPFVIAATAFGALAGSIAGIFWMTRNIELNWAWPDFDSLAEEFRHGRSVFFSRVWMTLYTSLIPTILGTVTSSVSVGYYMLADRIRAGIMSFLNPIIYAIIPRISHLFSINDRASIPLLKKSILVLTIVSAAFSIIIFTNAELIIRNISGPEYTDAVGVLKIFSVLPIVVTMSNIISQLILIPKSYSHYYSRYTFYGAVLALISVVPFVKYFDINGAALSMVAAELLTFVCFCTVAWKLRVEIFQK